MERDLITENLRTIFSTTLNLSPEEITDELSPDTCELWDSLHHIHLVAAIDEEFEITLDIEQQIEMLNFGLAVEVVSEVMNGRS